MTRQAQLADGSVLEFPDGTPDDVVDRTVKQHIGAASAPPAPVSNVHVFTPANAAAYRANVDPGQLTRAMGTVPLSNTLSISPESLNPAMLAPGPTLAGRKAEAAGPPKPGVVTPGFDYSQGPEGGFDAYSLLDAITNNPLGTHQAAASSSIANATGNIIKGVNDAKNAIAPRLPDVMSPGVTPTPQVATDLFDFAGANKPATPTPVTDMVGGIVPYAATAMIPGVGAPLAAAEMGAAGASSAQDRVVKAGKAGTPEGNTAVLGNAAFQTAVGAIPAGKVLEGFAPAMRGPILNFLAKNGIHAVAGAAQGAAMGAGENAIIKGTVDPKQDLGAGVTDQASSMAALNLITGLLHGNGFHPDERLVATPGGATVQPIPPATPTPEPQAPDAAPPKLAAPQPTEEVPRPAGTATPTVSGGAQGEPVPPPVQGAEPVRAPEPVKPPEPAQSGPVAANDGQRAPAESGPPVGGPAPADQPSGSAPLRPEPGELADGERYVTTPAGNRVRTRFEVVDGSTLTPADGDLQNRDRSKAGTDLQLNDIVSKFDPTRLGDSAETDRGAPIVGPDNIVESGNGRVAAIKRVQAEDPAKAQSYADHIRSLGLDPDSVQNPVLIRRRMTDLTPEQRRQFVVDSNKDAKLEMSPVEQARSDADNLDPATMSLYRGGDVEAAHNADFRKAFMAKLTPQEQGAMIDEHGAMNNRGASRLEAAVMARAYENPDILTKLIEARDNNIRSIGGAMLDHSADWAALRGDIKAGRVKPEFDVTRQLVQAAREVSDLRSRRGDVLDHLDQQDVFNQRDPVTDQFIRAFYNHDLSRAAGREAIGEVLQKYASRAAKQSTEPSMFGDDKVTPEDILSRILAERDQARNQPKLFAAEDRAPTQDNHDATESPARRNESSDERQPGEDAGGQGEARPGRPERSGGEPGGRSRRDPVDGGGRAGDGAGIARSSGDGDRSGAEGGEAVNEDRSGVTGESKGAYRDTFMEASHTDRPSVYEGAIRDTGVDPDRFRLLPTARQLYLLKKGFLKKYGIEVTVEPKMQDRVAIDQLIDAHQTVQGMAHVLGISERAISLDGALKIHLMKKGPFLGAFQPGANRIMLPGRSNSFAHEWGHALDHHLLGQVSDEQARGLSGLLRAKGVEFEPTNVKEAFVKVLNSMFFDKAGVARKVMVLEAKIEATKSAKQKAALQAQIDHVTAGNSRAAAPSNYFRNAKSLDKTNADYWTSPTEMFARAFEAYVSNMAEAADQGAEFIGKGDSNYRSDSDERFAKTFPKGEERDAIFNAIGELMGHVNTEQMLGPEGPPADPADMSGLRRLTDFDSQVSRLPNGGLIKQQLDAFQRAARKKAEALMDRANDPTSLWQHAQNLQSFLLGSMSSKLLMLDARYGGNTAIREIHDKLAFEPGKSRATPATFAEAGHMASNRDITRLSNILKANGMDDLTMPEQRQLRDLLIGERDPEKPAPALMVKAAAQIRRLLDGAFYAARNAGIDIGYATNGYMPRQLDHPKIAFNEDGFLSQAGKAYEHVFDRDHGEDGDAVSSDDDKLKNFLTMAKGYGIDGVNQVRSLLRQIEKFETDPENNGEPADELHAQLRELIDEMHPEVRKAFGDDKAMHWLTAMKTSADYDQSGTSPESGFAKGRELTPEADKLLEDFYIHDPVEAVHTYLHQSARRVAYAERFGPNNEIRDELFEKMVAQGVTPDDQEAVKKVLTIATGRQQSGVQRSQGLALSLLRTHGHLSLLSAATITKVAEPIVAGITSGDFRESFRAMATSMVGTRSLGGRQRAELARAIGIIADHSADQIAMDRMGGHWGSSPRLDRLSTRMFQATGLTAMIRTQSAQVLASAHAYLDHAAGQVLSGTGGNKPSKGDRTASDLGMAKLREYGVQDPVTFARQIREAGRMPSVEELDSNYGRAYALASYRYVKQTIQEPTSMSRQEASQGPVGSTIYGITSFANEFYRNVIKRQMNATADIARIAGPGAAVQHIALGVAPAAVALYVMQGMFQTAKMFLLNKPRWDELEAQGNGELEKYLAMRALTTAFPLGIADPFIQAYSGIKYQRGLLPLLIGPAASNAVDQLTTILKLGVTNSPNNNSAEHDAVKAAYSLAVAPAINVGLAMAPGGPLVDPLVGAAMIASTRQTTADAAATLATGPKTIHRAKPMDPRHPPPDHPLWSLGGKKKSAAY